MSEKWAIKKSTLDDIGNAIREKEGSTEPIPVNALADRIGALQIGGGENKVAQVVDKTVTEITAEDLDGATKIGDYAFRNCENLKKITFSNTITFIGSYAFSYCTSLTDIKISNSVTEIANNAFSACMSLPQLIIPNSVKRINSALFYSCNALKTIRVGNGVTYIGSGAFNANTVTDIYIDAPENSISGSPWGATNAQIHWNTPLPSEEV